MNREAKSESLYLIPVIKNKKDDNCHLRSVIFLFGQIERQKIKMMQTGINPGSFQEKRKGDIKQSPLLLINNQPTECKIFLKPFDYHNKQKQHKSLYATYIRIIPDYHQ